MRAQDFLSLARKQLAEAGIPAPLHEAQMLACHVLNCDRTALLSHPERALSEWQESQLLAMLQQRRRRYPLQYLLGEWEFFGRSFVVNPSVLIPRPETEILVETALELGPSRSSVLDIGTGSGCIAVTLACERPTWRVAGCDISGQALQIAALNRRRLGGHTVALFQADAGRLPLRLRPGWNLIVSNPPYAAQGDPRIDPEVHHEPTAAVFAGDNGLAAIRTILAAARPLLLEEGLLLLEVGEGQADTVAGLAVSRGWKEVGCRRDLSGIDRCLVFSGRGE